MIATVISYVIIIGVVEVSYLLVPFIVPDTVQFGVRVPPAHTDSPAIARARRSYFRNWVVVLLLILVAGVIVGIKQPAPDHQSVTVVVLAAAILILNYANYYMARRRLMNAKVEESWYEGVTEGVVADTTIHQALPGPSLLWAIPDVLVTAVAVVIPAMRYNQIPERVAIHFNAGGIANGFAAKSLWSVFGTEFIQIVLLVVMIIVQLNLNRFAVRLNPANPRASRLRFRTIIREAVKALWITLALLNAGTLLMTLPIWGVGSSREPLLGALGTALILLGVVVCVIWLAVAAQVSRHVDDTALKSQRVARDDDKYWLAGAMYFNPSDPAFFVPKRFGLGITLNFGHPISWIVLVLIIGVPVVISRLAR